MVIGLCTIGQVNQELGVVRDIFIHEGLYIVYHAFKECLVIDDVVVA
jgi:hypothetical protein